MTTWTAEITINLRDDGAEELYALTGIDRPRDVITGTEPARPSGTVTVKVTADDAREAFKQALEQAARML